MRLQLSCVLEVLHPQPNEIYTIQISSYTTFIISDSIKLIDVVITDEVPALLNFEYYVTGGHDDALIPTQLCMATAFMSMFELKSAVDVLFKDPDDRLQARLRVDWLNRDLEWLKTHVPSQYEHKDSNEYAQSLIDETKTRYLSGRFQYNRQRQAFIYVMTPVGPMPIVCFPLLATMSTTLTDDTNRFLLRMWMIAMKLNANDVIGEMLTMLTKCMVYTSDRTRTVGNTTLFNESWDRCLQFPNRALAGYDCEDAAQMVQEICYPLRSSTLLPTPLIPIRNILSKCTVFTVEGDMMVDEWTPHCYVHIADSDYIDYLLGKKEKKSEYLPSMVIEGTDWNESIWTTESLLMPSVSIPNRLLPLIKVWDSNQKVQQSKRYGLIAQMQTADHRGRMLTLAMISDGVMGVSLEDMMFHRATPNDVEVWMDSTRQSDLLRALAPFPLTSLPVWTEPDETFDTAVSKTKMVMRWIDYETLQDDVDRCFPQMTKQKIQVTDDHCSFCLLTSS